ncbi:twin transmembrane helix small protein [Sphingosinicella sp. YJ22]|uniref:twin transmembrane helix small protein n=1 Tax=Sphingosinicella sp. YJ22 TaxID=1104780 RepID=UPI001408A648|nr:twin transmembrane helix small protein [Sphingosinicella sp. YJ22]
MQPILIILLVIAALATLFVLIRGVVGLANNQTPERSQELMRKRILYQAIAILLAVLLLLTFGSR